MKIKRKELDQLHSGLRKCGSLTGEKFTYMIEKNVKKIMQERKKVDRFAESLKVKEPSANLLEFTKLDQTIYSDMQAGTITEAIAKEKQNELKERFPEEAKMSEEFMQKMTDYLDEEIEVDFHTIKREDLPVALTADMRIGIGDFIDE
jgi:isoleucyl-tRNA synthetase